MLFLYSVTMSKEETFCFRRWILLMQPPLPVIDLLDPPTKHKLNCPHSPKRELFTLYFIASTFELLHVVVLYNPILSKPVASGTVMRIDFQSI